ncbi:MAG TPA: arylsulfotransferase family protein [Solirubrobacteraceae bacterium]|nr:arylsulfotransferase family protein [Solirubrobacteraceae bacterium]
MKRFGYSVLLVAVLAWVIVAVVLSAKGSAKVELPPSGPSPDCLPGHVDRSAAIAGTPLDVSPAPYSVTATPSTQISFLGVPVTDISNVDVEGASSGYHHGHLDGYYQGDGGSFVPNKPFDDGEKVTVRADVTLRGARHAIDYSFHVDTPYPSEELPEFPNPPAPPATVQQFTSAPGLQAPRLEVTAADRDPGAGDILMTTGPGPGQPGPLIYGPQGQLIWFSPLASGTNALNLTVQRYEGKPVLTWWQGHVRQIGFGQGEDIVMNSAYQRVVTVHGGNGLRADLHDFRIAPDDVAYITAYNVMRCNLEPVGGKRNGTIIAPAIQEVDMKTGLVRWEWNSLDHVPVRASHTPQPEVSVPWDYFHLNSIDVLHGSLLISARNTWALYKLRAGSGTIQWSLGGDESSFAVEKSAKTAWQHDARMLPDGQITAFDDGASPRQHFQSRGVRLAIEHGRVRLLRVFFHPGAPLLAGSQGNVQTLPDGDVVVGWGAVPSVSEFSPGGELLFDAHMAPGNSSYRAFRFKWNGHPLTAPAIVARVMAASDSTAVAVSWNGATGVRSWRILAGESSDALTAQATVPDAGFEATAQLAEPFKYAAVQALGAHREVLATSQTISVTPAPPTPK